MVSKQFSKGKVYRWFLVKETLRCHGSLSTIGISSSSAFGLKVP